MLLRSLKLTVIFSLLLGACSMPATRQATSLPTNTALPVENTAAPAPTATAVATPTAPTASSDNTASSGGAASAAPAESPIEITGSFSFTNDILLTYYVEHAVAMVDLYAFTQRDEAWEVPVQSHT